MSVFKNGRFYHYEFKLDGRRRRGSTGTANKQLAIAEERRQEVGLAVLRDGVDHLRDAGGHGRRTRDLDAHGIAEREGSDLLDLRPERRREKERLLFLGELREDLLAARDPRRRTLPWNPIVAM